MPRAPTAVLGTLPPVSGWATRRPAVCGPSSFDGRRGVVRPHPVAGAGVLDREVVTRRRPVRSDTVQLGPDDLPVGDRFIPPSP